MLLHASEYSALKETIKECKELADEFGLSFADVVQVRQLLFLDWATRTWLNRDQTPTDK